MEGDELFDANLLEQTVNSLIEDGKRNFAIDLSKIDYLYSDSINKFINLNHKVLNVYGRLTLLSPNNQVDKILKRAGIQNFLKIYESVDELQRASDEIIQQTTTLNIKDIQNYQQDGKKDVSEFEDFRSEIGKAIDSSTYPDQQKEFSNYSQSDSAFSPSEYDRTQDFSEPTKGQKKPYFISPQHQNASPLFTQQPLENHFSPAPPQYQNFSAPPIQSPPPPPQQPIQQPQQPPKYGQQSMPGTSNYDMPQSPVPPATQPQAQQPPYSYPPQQMGQEYRQPHPTSPGLKPAPTTPRPPTALEREELFEESSKKFPIIFVIAPILGIIIVLVGVFIFFNPFKDTPFSISNLFKGKSSQTVVPEPKPADVIPPIPSEGSTPGKVPGEIDVPESETVTEEPEVPETPVVKEPEKPVTKPVVTRKSTRTPRKGSRSGKKPVKQVSANRIQFTSYPSKAKIMVDNNLIGRTPYIWKNPSVYGMVDVVIDKEGYEAKTINFEFTGGSLKKHAILMKERAAPRVTQPEVDDEPELEEPPEPIKKPKPVVKKPEPEPEPVASNEGVIFLSTIPPMADVYMDGVKIGRSNVDELKVTAGTHTMRFVKGSKEVTKQMTFTEGQNPSQLIRIK